jgi:hypothetical protein
MNASLLIPAKFVAFVALTALIAAPRLASGLNLDTHVSTPQQYGIGSGFNFGHTVVASTIYSNLVAGGTYTAQCNHPSTLPVTGERTLSSTTLGLGGNQLYVTVPANQPGLTNLSGWYQVSPGTTLSCNYRWTAYATESGMTIGAGGISYTIGSATERRGGTVDFTMTRGVTGAEGAGCGP